ncbi:Guanylate cyclase 2G [Terramyces sp. JEL0728]|nr:Guanylate cyclase 2G [Terramyces sp. JEL0728]
MSMKVSALRKTTEKSKKNAAVTNSGPTLGIPQEGNNEIRRYSGRASELLLPGDADDAHSNTSRTSFNVPNVEQPEVQRAGVKSEDAYLDLRNQTEIVERNVAIGEAEVLKNKEIAFLMRQNEMAISNLTTAQNIDFQKMKQLYDRTLVARRERKLNKRETRKTIRGAKKRDLIIQQQEKSALAASRVKETIAEKRLAFDLLNAHMKEVHDTQRNTLISSQDRKQNYEKLICDLETSTLKPEVRNTIMKKLQVRHSHQGHLNKLINDNLREFQLLELQHIKEKFELEMVSFDEVGNRKIVHENRLAEMKLRHMNEIHEEKENVMMKKEAAKEIQLHQKHERELGAVSGNLASSKGGSMPGSVGGSKIGSKIGSKVGSIQGSKMGSVANSAPRSRDEFAGADVVTDATTNKSTLQQGLADLLREVADEAENNDDNEIENGSKYPKSVQLLMIKHRKELSELEREIKKELNDFSLAYEVKSSDMEAAQQAACETLLEQQYNLVEETREAQEKEIKMEETMHDNEMKMLVERRVLTSVLGSISDGIININPQGIITRFNRAAETIFQWKASDILGRNVSLLMGDDNAEKHNHYIKTYLTTGAAKVVNSGRRVQGKRKDGTHFTMHLSISELKEGEMHLFTGIVHDLTEEIAEEERQKAIETAKKKELEAFAEKLDHESKKCDDLLRQILPASVSEALMNGRQVEPQHFAAASVFYFDLVGFTTISAQVSPLEIVGLLNDLYEQFDNVIANYDAYKVETIGDSYMIASGVPKEIENHASELAKMAIHLLEVAKGWVYKPNPNIKIRLRMGINSGPVITGVVGTKMPRYCLFGETCMIASKMESSGSPMRIHISEATHDLLSKDETFRMTKRQEVEIKGKGIVTTYWLDSKDEFDPLGQEIITQ